MRSSIKARKQWKKLKWLWILQLSLIGIYSSAPSQLFCEESALLDSLVEVKAGYFFFTSSKMREVYSDGGVDIQISGETPLSSHLHLYGSIEYLERSGRSREGDQHTSLWEIPISVGLRPIVAIGKYGSYYATIGPRYFFVQVHNRSSYVPKHMEANGCGGFINTGFLFRPKEHLVFDMFAEYSYKQLSFPSSKQNTQGHTVQVGGLSFGGGAGYIF